MDFTEFNALRAGLDARGISYIISYFLGGKQIKTSTWDAVINEISYGHEHGLLEIMGDLVDPDVNDSVEGWLTAENILKRIDGITETIDFSFCSKRSLELVLVDITQEFLKSKNTILVYDFLKSKGLKVDLREVNND